MADGAAPSDRAPISWTVDWLDSTMTRLHQTIALGVLAITCGSLHGRTADFDIGATVVPSACSILLNRQGVINYGDIPRHRLNKTRVTPLYPHVLNVTISCQQPTRFAVRLKDERAASALQCNAGDSCPVLRDDQNAVIRDYVPYGLGFANGKKIGGFVMSMANNGYQRTDKLWAQILMSNNNGRTWSIPRWDQKPMANAADWVSWSLGGEQPSAQPGVFLTLKVEPLINPLDSLPSNQVIELDGLASFTVEYL